MGHRLYNLDPKRKYINAYKDTICEQLGQCEFSQKTHHPLTLTFAVGGAGAQREYGVDIVKSLRRKLIKGQIRINLVAGIRNEVASYFKDSIKDLGWPDV